jgi:hypothetical protein
MTIAFSHVIPARQHTAAARCFSKCSPRAVGGVGPGMAARAPVAGTATVLNTTGILLPQHYTLLHTASPSCNPESLRLSASLIRSHRGAHRTSIAICDYYVGNDCQCHSQNLATCQFEVWWWCYSGLPREVLPRHPQLYTSPHRLLSRPATALYFRGNWAWRSVPEIGHNHQHHWRHLCRLHDFHILQQERNLCCTVQIFPYTAPRRCTPLSQLSHPWASPAAVPTAPGWMPLSTPNTGPLHPSEVPGITAVSPPSSYALPPSLVGRWNKKVNRR